MRINGHTSNDYFDVTCAVCGEHTKNRYLGGDPAVPHFEATCEKCGKSGTFKLNVPLWTGLPLKASA